MADVVYSALPFKLILRFQRFSDALCNRHKLEASIADFVDFVQLLHELAGQQEAVEEGAVVLRQSDLDRKPDSLRNSDKLVSWRFDPFAIKSSSYMLSEQSEILFLYIVTTGPL